MAVATPEEVNRTVAFDLRIRKISQREAGEIIGRSQAAISTQLSSNRRFGKKMAHLFSQAFGYNAQYLLFGEGELKGNNSNSDIDWTPKTDRSKISMDLSVLTALVAIADEIIACLGDNNAKDAWMAINRGDLDGFIKNMNRVCNSFASLRPSTILAKYICERIQFSNLRKKLHLVAADPEE